MIESIIGFIGVIVGSLITFIVSAKQFELQYKQFILDKNRKNPLLQINGIIFNESEAPSRPKGRGIFN